MQRCFHFLLLEVDMLLCSGRIEGGGLRERSCFFVLVWATALYPHDMGGGQGGQQLGLEQQLQ